MKKMTALLLSLLLLLPLCVPPALASATLDAQAVYETARVYVQLGMLQEALSEFQRIPSYADSLHWSYYCSARLALQEADTLEASGYLVRAEEKINEASRVFAPLAASQFEDTEKLVTYCSARLYQLRGLRQYALDLFQQLFGVLDSDRRYFDLINGVALPTQAPDDVLSPVLTSYPAQAAGKIKAYAGPGSGYTTVPGIRLQEGTALRVCAKDGAYYLNEAETKKGLVRFWTVDYKITPESALPELPVLSPYGEEGFVMKDAAALLGPGEGYRDAELVLKRGTKVTAFLQEDLYTMIEYQAEGAKKKTRVWVLTECLQQ